ncbi:MAG: chromosomal replication initiator protein DnaA, partial [Oceanicoccus sp.]|uniref:DnaA ATPase domain-containing protein n=1 Tax=Oceanicoccus sp. TaxID=2691044 RepID=UPI00337ED343|nr:chromosomal replication initiator protein DnaA [Oceanicoccus sp.]
MKGEMWEKCLKELEQELSTTQFNTWVRPLQAIDSEGSLFLLAPNKFVNDWIKEHYWGRIKEIAGRISGEMNFEVQIKVGSRESNTENKTKENTVKELKVAVKKGLTIGLQKDFTFDTFVEGKCNQLAKAASIQVANNPGVAYNPLFIYGGVGLGKTHLMHAVGNYL